MMPDIAMCTDHGCPSRTACRRYVAEPSVGRQTYGSFTHNVLDGKCVCCWPTTESKERAMPVNKETPR